MKTRAEFDANARRLIGFEIARVVYYEIDYQAPKPYFRDHPEIGHFLDFGIELIDPAGISACITWDGTFFQYGLGVFVNTRAKDLFSAKSYDVSETAEWLPYIGKKIDTVDSYWSWVADSMASNAARTYYPQDMRIIFDNDRTMYMSAMQYLEESGKLFGMSDNLMIVFDDAVAKLHHIGPWAVE